MLTVEGTAAESEEQQKGTEGTAAERSRMSAILEEVTQAKRSVWPERIKEETMREMTGWCVLTE